MPRFHAMIGEIAGNAVTVRTGEHTQPASQLLQVVELLERWKISPAELLSPFGLGEDDILVPEARVSVATYTAILRRARMLTGEPGLGFYLGLQRRISRYGKVGLAAMNAATLREAIEIFVRFTPLITSSITLRLRVDGDVAALAVDEHADTGDVRDIVEISFVLGIQQIGKTQTGRDFSLGRTIDLPIAEPSYFPRFAHLLPNVRFEQPVLQFVFDAASLDMPLSTPDRATLNLLRQECERDLLQLGFETSLAQTVRKLAFYDGGVRSQEEVAAKLGVSPRTLKRRLAAASTQFSEVVEAERRERALVLLRSKDLSIAQIGERLGYSNETNFARAFRRWTGQTPAAHRRAGPR